MQRTALVTGANRGIGAAIAKGLAASGLRVILGVRDVVSADDTFGAIKGAGGEAVVIKLDVGDVASIGACTDQLEADGTTIDVLINNAGILDGDRLMEMSPAAVERSIAINALGPLVLIQKLAPEMVARRFGRIVNMSSDWGSLESLGPGAYGVSKALLNAITVKLAGELPSNVKVNAMCPGWVRTDMGLTVGASAPRSPEEGADTAIWLATLPDDGPSGGMFRDRQPLSW